MMPFLTAKTTFISPLIPAASLEWPMLLLMNLIINGFSAERVGEKTDAAAATSIGSSHFFVSIIAQCACFAKGCLGLVRKKMLSCEQR